MYATLTDRERDLAALLYLFPLGECYVVDMIHPADPGVWRNHPEGQYSFRRVRTAEEAAGVIRDNPQWRCFVRRQVLDRTTGLWEDAPDGRV